MPHTQTYHRDNARTPQADFRITYHGTVTTITPLSDACREWLEENVEIEPWQRFGNSIAVEPRYVEQLAKVMIEQGLVIVEDEASRTAGAGEALSPDTPMRPTSSRYRHGAIRIIALVALALSLTGCGLAKHYQNEQARTELSTQVTADANRCRQGDQNACRLYEKEIQRCVLFATDPVCQNW